MNNQFDYVPQNDGIPPIDFGLTPPQQQPKRKGNGFAIAALVLGIVSVVVSCCCCCLYYLSLVLSIVAIVMAVLAKRENGGKMPGKATAGLILAIIGLVLFLMMVCVEIAFAQGLLDEAFYDATGMTMEEYMDLFYGELYGDTYGDTYGDYYETVLE